MRVQPYNAVAAATCGLLITLSNITPISALQHNNNNTNQNIFQQLSNILLSEQASIETSSIYDAANVKVIGEDDAESLSSAMLKTYIRANNMRAYHLDLHSYRPAVKFSGDPNYVDSENSKHIERCFHHLTRYHHLLKSFYESDPILSKNSRGALKLADSFGRPESGLLAGNQFWLGDYDNCHGQEHVAFNQEAVKSQYCLGVTQFPNWNPQDSKTSIKIGLCLPETCTTSMLNDNPELFKVVDSMMRYPFALSTSGLYGKLKLREVYCLPHETSEIRQYSLSALCFLTVLALFLGTCIIATTIDYLNRKVTEDCKQPSETNWRSIIIESFSLTRNMEKFLSVREEQQQANFEREEGSFDKGTFFNSIAGLKCIGLCWIICAHTFLVAPIPAKNLIDLDKLTKTYLADIYLTAHLMVDTFFCLSGILAAYFIFKEGIDRIKTKHWIIMTAHRYWRLTPIYLLCYWYSKAVGHLMSSGPLWDYMTAEASPRLNCARESWFEAILQLSDFKSPKEHCVPFAWFIANGIKFWILTPIFLILINKSIKRGYIFSITTIIANIILVGTLAMRSNVDMKSVIEFKPESADNMLNNMGEIYTRPYSRIGAYLIGLLAGHFIYMIETNQVKVKLTKNMNAFLWTLFTVIVCSLTFVLKIANGMKLDEAAIPVIFGACSALIRPLWSLCTCWLVFAMAHGQVQPLSRFLTAKCWRILVKLSFCAYLAQGEVIAQMYLAVPTSYSFQYVDMFSKPIVTIILTIIVSFIMVLVLEYPLCGIEQLILPKRIKNSKPVDENNLKAQCSEKIKSS